MFKSVVPKRYQVDNGSFERKEQDLYSRRVRPTFLLVHSHTSRHFDTTIKVTRRSVFRVTASQIRLKSKHLPSLHNPDYSDLFTAAHGRLTSRPHCNILLSLHLHFPLCYIFYCNQPKKIFVLDMLSE